MAAQSAGTGITGVEIAVEEEKDRFDHLMAVYAAMVEAIDTSVGVLVKGLEALGASTTR